MIYLPKFSESNQAFSVTMLLISLYLMDVIRRISMPRMEKELEQFLKWLKLRTSD